MGFLDRLFGREGASEERRPAPERRGFDRPASSVTDEQALERYRYMLRTAPPEAIEQAHEEAFAKLTPAQRAQALQELSQAVPAHERVDGSRDDPRTLARMATRAELRQPGTLERAFGGVGGMGGGMGFGGMLAGSLLGSLAGSFIGTAVAQQFFDHDPGYAEGGLGDQAANQELLSTQEDYTGATGEDFAADDFGDSGDFGGSEV